MDVSLLREEERLGYMCYFFLKDLTEGDQLNFASLKVYVETND